MPLFVACGDPSMWYTAQSHPLIRRGLGRTRSTTAPPERTHSEGRPGRISAATRTPITSGATLAGPMNVPSEAAGPSPPGPPRPNMSGQAARAAPRQSPRAERAGSNRPGRQRQSPFAARAGSNASAKATLPDVPGRTPAPKPLCRTSRTPAPNVSGRAHAEPDGRTPAPTPLAERAGSNRPGCTGPRCRPHRDCAVDGGAARQQAV